MEYQAIDIDEKLNEDEKGKRVTSLPSGESSNEKRETNHENDALEGRSTQEPNEQQTREAGPSLYYGHEDSEGEESQQPKNKDHHETEFDHFVNFVEGRLEEWRKQAREEGNASSICIFRLPHGLIGRKWKAAEPQLVSIGPYHRGKDRLLEFEKHKWYFLDKLLSRQSGELRSPSIYLREMRKLEENTRACYSDPVVMSSPDFVEIMLLDACFVVGLLDHLVFSKDSVDKDDPILTKPWVIPILMRDLLKLENQLPFFVLEKLFRMSLIREGKTVAVLALKVFYQIFPLPSEIFFECNDFESKHLLDLLYLSLLPSNQKTKSNHLDTYRPSSQSIQCVTQLRPSGIKFKPRKFGSFLDIKFQNRVLEIPIITVNDFTSTLLLNCVAWEQCQEDKTRYFTDYVSFMNCLINQPRDVALLYQYGIITGFSQDDYYVIDLFSNLGKNIVMNVHSCYLYKEFVDLDAYFNSHWATMMRTYFRSPWSIISVFSGIFIIVLTLTQTIMSVLSYLQQSGLLG